MKTIEDLDLEDKKILLRVDLNSSVRKGRVRISPRMKAHAKTIEELCDRGAKVVVLAHQGRPGRDDFLHLDQHGENLNRLLDRRVIFIEDICDKLAEKVISELHAEDVLLLDNVRMHTDELRDVDPKEHATSELVTKLSELCDLYINDAFSICHRNHASVTGFPLVMESAVGPLLEEDLGALEHIEESKGPRHFILGGNKPKSAIKVTGTVLERGLADTVLLGGTPGEIFLEVKGFDLDSKNHEINKVREDVEYILENHGEEVVVPVDLAYQKNKIREEVDIEDLPVDEEVMDIGTGTVKKYIRKLEEAETVVMNGPVGVFEKKNFQKGTEKVLEFLNDNDRYVLVGGGDTSHALEDLGFDFKGFEHVSLAGGAFVRSLLGEKLIGLEVLE